MRKQKKYSSEISRIISGTVIVYLAVCILIDMEAGAAGTAKAAIGLIIGILGLLVILFAGKDIAEKRKG